MVCNIDGHGKDVDCSMYSSDLASIFGHEDSTSRERKYRNTRHGGIFRIVVPLYCFVDCGWVFQFPFLLITGEKVRWVFVFKAIIVPIAFLTVMAWSMYAGGGFANSPIAEQQATISSSALGWAFMNALNASLGTNCTTLGVNVADFTCYAKTPKAQYVQLGKLLKLSMSN